jgi:DNA-binding NarL/FixJ family response regulator
MNSPLHPLAACGLTAAATYPTRFFHVSVLNCFLVEDSPVIRQNLVATLEEMLPMRVVGIAEDESTALQWLQESPTHCDLLIIDVFLRTGTGLEVLRRAKSLRPQANLVVLTNYATPEMRRRCEELGADRLFDKSAELEDLLAYCEALTERRAH